MKIQKGVAGNADPKTKSDCYVCFETTTSDGIDIDLTSKVMPMYGETIRTLATEILDFFEIKNCKLKITDKGALDFVLAARIEAAIKQVVDTKKNFLLPILEENMVMTARNQFRLSRLYLPGNTPKLMINAGIHKANGIILDLEDAVAPAKKYEASFIVRNALRNVNFYGAEKMVRINQLPRGLDDLEFVVPHYVNLIIIPKCESANQIHQVEEKIATIERDNNNAIYFMPIIESALGVEKAFEIATASKNVVAMAIGLEDLTADFGVKRTFEAKESLYARTRLVCACKAAGIQPIDSVFSDVADMEGLKQNVLISKSLGFEGMGCIHPRQINVIHENFAPEKSQIERAKKIVLAFKDAEEKGLGVISIGTKMIDPPVVKRAETTLKFAIEVGLLDKNWIQLGIKN